MSASQSTIPAPLVQVETMPMLSTSLRPIAPNHSPSPLQIETLRDELAEMITRTRALPEGDFESSTRATEILERIVHETTLDARTLLDQVRIHYTHMPTATGTSADPVLGLVAIGRMEFTELLGQMERRSGASWQRVSVCDRAYHVVRRCIRALDGLIADVEAMPRLPDDLAAETECAVQIRRAYVALHRAALGAAMPDAETIRPRLRAAGAGIAALLASEVGSSVRAHDRHMMRALQARIREVLLDPSRDGASAEALRRLWQDLTGFTRLLLEVNQREVLCAHDRDAFAFALADMSIEPAAAMPPAEVFVSLARCEGRDPDLDALLASRTVTVGALREQLKRSLSALAPRASGRRDG